MTPLIIELICTDPNKGAGGFHVAANILTTCDKGAGWWPELMYQGEDWQGDTNHIVIRGERENEDFGVSRGSGLEIGHYALNDDLVITDDDLRIDTYRECNPTGMIADSGYGNAVRITHLPTGIDAMANRAKSTMKNRNNAMSILKAKVSAYYDHLASEYNAGVIAAGVATAGDVFGENDVLWAENIALKAALAEMRDVADGLYLVVNHTMTIGTIRDAFAHPDNSVELSDVERILRAEAVLNKGKETGND